ncbi:phospholipase D p1-like protein [Carex littledalei]|uniref:Phospholipase n=1 Tax=Carex littledalei TaxID=544730 RepID=A0A833QNB4_9POAL|nr:phospholipase D p1-like protein [Carex littledalei]
MTSNQISAGEASNRYVKMQSEPPIPSPRSFRTQSMELERERIFEELPRGTVVSVSRPDAGDITPMLLTYTIELEYKQFRWTLIKKASQVFYLHFALKRRVFIEELHEKQEQVKEWIQNLGLGDHIPFVHDEDEADDEPIHMQHDESSSVKNRNVPSSAALPMIRPALGRQHSISERGQIAMQGYLNRFLGNLDIVNSREVCRFLEVSRLSFLLEYGPKLKEDYVNVWAVLKPGFLALLEDPLDSKLLDIILFDVLPSSDGNGEGRVVLAKETKERNPLHSGFQISCGSRTVKMRLRSKSKVTGWVAAINDAGLRPPEGWCHPHRFGSFAPPRGFTDDGTQAQWFVDGEAAFAAIAASIEEAKSEIFITDWWMCPELYLRRPFHLHASSRLDFLLEERAKQGVQIYILLYKEVTYYLKINSIYSKRRLLNVHENIRVLRYPDHISSGVYLWSHHEKIVIVDNQICFIGGLDLCFGRYDNPEHKVGDFPPSIWPGKDYYNPRESEPNSWEDTMKDALDRERYPRMPWHDVQCALWGPPCRDLARHFVQRWNHAKRNKAPNEPTIPLLMPQQHMITGNHSIVADEINSQDDIHAPLLSPKNSEMNRVDIDLGSLARSNARNRKNRDDNSDQDLQMQAFVDEIRDTPQPLLGKNLHASVLTEIEKCDREWWEMQERGYQVDSLEESGQVGPRTSCHCQVVRSVSQWSAGTSQIEESIHNAYCTLIDKAEHFIYIENQFFVSGLSGDDIIKNRVLEALYQRILRAVNENKCFRVIIVIPLLPGFQGGVDDGGAASVRAIMHWQYRTICRGPRSILQNLYDVVGPKAHDYISFYGLRTYGRLHDGGPLVTNMIYVHSKLMIIDDRIALIGSANINDRSLLGSRDSEIGVLIEDKDMLPSRMNGKIYKAGKFTRSLRISLWAEHLGLHRSEIDQIIDPIDDATYKDIWMATAKTNTIVYQDVFSCVPNDLIHTRVAFRQSTAYWKEKIGHTTTDLGVAPERLEASSVTGDDGGVDPMERLKLIKGHLVSFPLDFMCKEDLRPVIMESEYYASHVFH